MSCLKFFHFSRENMWNMRKYVEYVPTYLKAKNDKSLSFSPQICFTNL